jgi:hypothetical protein
MHTCAAKAPCKMIFVLLKTVCDRDYSADANNQFHLQ